MIKNILFVILVSFVVLNLNAQYTSVHHQQLDYYNSLGNAEASFYEKNTIAVNYPNSSNKAGCALNKTVYGWHPYWVGSAYLNYNWNLLSHFSFFSYEVDAATGNANSTHGWATSAAVDAALASGNTKVTLTVTLFSNHATFFSSPTAQQTLITNLINLIQSRGAHGVNIDIEGLPSANKNDFTNFMISLANQMHAAIPNSEVSTVLYAVDWNNVFDFSSMASVVDQFIIMGYDYYWSGSSSTGPNDPLYHFDVSYNFSLSKSITYYLNKGCPKDKLILGLPYYGREWSTSSVTVPSSTTASGNAKIYNDVKDNISGNYSLTNYAYDTDSYSDIYVFNNGTQKQCFISLENSIIKRLEHINTSGIGGMGIWALGYDDGYTELWDAIENNMTDCFSNPCSGEIHDFGGPTKNYYDNENYTWTIQPKGATSIALSFTSFDVETDFDYLYIYDGNTDLAPQISGSPFTGTTLPPDFNSTTGAITFKFTSDNLTTKSGFTANYTCIIDTIKPTTQISLAPNPAVSNFSSTFTDADNLGGSGVKHQFYQVADHNGTEWFSNDQNGFFNDEFNNGTIHSNWIDSSGVWNNSGVYISQTDESNSNTNIYASCNQNGYNKYLYNYQMQISGSGANKRAGFHYMCDDASQPNRGNSYFIWFRQDDAKLQFYKVVNDTFSLEKDVSITYNANQWYDIKIVYDKITGETEVWMDDDFVSSWIDVSPLTIGNHISLRSGNCIYDVENLRVYKNRTATELINVGSNPSDDIRYSGTPAGRINSIVIDNAYNVSVLATEFVNVDLTTSLEELNNIDFEVYPNPTNHNITVSFNDNQNRDIRISNIGGKTLITQKIVAKKQTINVSDLVPGIYFLKVKSNNELKTIKLIKQ
ncbi:T9SS type A sorting domain-containing protein [Vicingus serpentipes]|uniref:T9SS type A sorting domain-containing protein n=1 Tax=Vicingus serpentipes TaxID=1926625 RepID=A0A5C6RXP9_9FLAO|nr:glycosyl hydrolase family 18 protein [Vicingus serpentipes]TXB67138.1 T9SS type A sorting domain-containing protein [Vicingus serpentipes]